MSPKKLFSCLIIIFLIASFTCAFAKTTKNYVLAYGAGWTDEYLRFVAERYDMIVTSAGNTTHHWIEVLRETNPDIIILWYHEAFSATASQPEFWLRQNDGSPILAYNNTPGRYVADPGNSDWRAYQAYKCSLDVAYMKVDGIFYDNVQPGHRFGAAFSYTTPDKYPNQETWQAAMQGLIDSVKTALGNKLLLVNSLFYWVKNVDGYMTEGICLPDDWHEDWLSDIETLSKAVADSQMTIPIYYPPDDSDRKILYCLASHLIYQGPKSYFYVPRVTSTGHSYTAPPPWNDLQAIDIGEPLAYYYKDQRMYKREYEKALVVVNPWHMAAPGNLTQSYVNVFGDTVGSDYWLESRSAEILYPLTTGIESANSVPDKITLFSAYPNPFNSGTVIKFYLKNPTDIELKIFDSNGRKVRKLSSGFTSAGEKQIFWDSLNESGERITSGIYLVQLISNNERKMIKILHVK